MKRLALVGSILLAIAVSVSFFLRTLRVRHEGSGWVMWEKTMEFSERQDMVVSWDIMHSYDSLASCNEMAVTMAEAFAEHAKLSHPEESVKYEHSLTMFTITGDGGHTQVTEILCFPSATDPRPRR